jgi:pimeloyl-ACP methyl ester carboxylesterase
MISDRLSRSGFHVMRFDYFGTGDSTGEDHEGDLQGWTEDILRAHDELVRRSGSQRSAWFGLRLGASLAALASPRAARSPRRLVLWDPIVDGPAYLAELVNAHIASRAEFFELRWEVETRLRSLVAEEARTEVLGYPLTPNLKSQLEALSLSSLGGLKAEQVNVLGSSGAGELARVQQQLTSSGIDVRIRAMESNIEWTSNEMLRDSMVLPEDIRTLVLAITEE